MAGIIDYEQGELRLYVDGSPAVSGPLTGMRLLDGTRVYEGELDELRVYTRSFAGDEISELF